MKKVLTLVMAAALVSGVAFAGGGEGKKCAKGKSCCKKEKSCNKEEKGTEKKEAKKA